MLSGETPAQDGIHPDKLSTALGHSGQLAELADRSFDAF